MKFQIPERLKLQIEKKTLSRIKDAFIDEEAGLLSRLRKVEPSIYEIWVEIEATAGSFVDIEKGVDFGYLAFRISCDPKITYSEYSISSFTLSEFPFCCGICISGHSDVSPKYRKLGIGTILHRIKERIAGDILGYSMLMATDVSDNEPENGLLAKTGWSKLMTFKNERTGHDVSIHIRGLSVDKTDL